MRQAKSEIRNRQPFGTKEARMPLPDLHGYVCRYFNDEENRINRAQSAGYEFVDVEEFPRFQRFDVAPNGDLGTRISLIVGTDDFGKPIRAYLMKIRKELYEADQAEKQAYVDRTDAAISGGKMGNPGPNSYVKQIEYGSKIS